MSAAHALAVVRQVQGLVEGPPTPEMQKCINQVASALLYFLDHPDSRVRQGSARTLAKLRTNFPEEFVGLDISRATAAYERLRASVTEGAEDEDMLEYRQCLLTLLGEVEAPPAPEERRTSVSEGRGEVILKMDGPTDARVKGAILEQTVKLAGVVSVTFEGDLVIVSTRTPAKAKEAGFLVELLAFVKEQGIAGVSLVSAAAAAAAMADSSPVAEPPPREDSSASEGGDLPDYDSGGFAEEGVGGGPAPGYLEDGFGSFRASDAAWGQGTGYSWGQPTNDSGWGHPSQAGAAALQLKGLGAQGLVGSLAADQQSLFSQGAFGAGRKIQEFGDDPSIAARLAAAKRKETQRKQENQSRLSRLASWFTGR